VVVESLQQKNDSKNHSKEGSLKLQASSFKQRLTMAQG